MRKNIVILLFAPLLISCANLKVTRNDSPTTGQEPVEIQMAYLVWGFAPIKKIPPADAICPKGSFDSVVFSASSSDAALTWLTLGFYVPHRAIIICGK